MIFNFEKTKSFLNYISQQHPGADIVVFAHGNNGLMLHKCVDNFDHDTHMLEYTPSNAQPITYYYDHDRQASVDLHLPYIDRYRFIQDGVTYRRVAEVLDCWFESGAMPFGQFHKIQDLQSQTLSDFPQYPADFIAE